MTRTMSGKLACFAAAAAAGIIALAWTTTPAEGQTGAKNGEWRAYGGDLGHTRYSPLDQINATNFKNLEIAWHFKTDHLGTRPEFQFEGTPLEIGGVLYSTAGTRRAVVALDATTGEELWVHSEHEGDRGAAAPRQLSGRGLAYWTDGREERILYVTPGYMLVALNAKTGMRVPGFGKDGMVDLKQDDDQVIDPMSSEIGLHSTPMVAKNVVIIGAAHKSGGVPTGKTNVKGYVRAFDVRTGKRLWIFHTIPRPGEFGNDTWEKDSWSYTGNAGVWAQMSVDEELGTAYLPVELPTGDYYGADRPGAGLFGESIVAVDLQTGKRKWHYQLVHHGLWDMDIPCAPIIADLTVDGRQIKAVAQPTKQGFLYVLDRVTGKPVWPIPEKPVEKGAVPGEWYSPTQPMPSKPPAYSRNGVLVEDLIDFTPGLRDQAMTLVARYKIGPVYTPPVESKVEGPLATLTTGTASGGTNWPGGSYDPETHTVYAYACNACVTAIGLVKAPKEISDMNYILGTAGQAVRIARGPGENAGADSPMPERAPAAPAGGGAAPAAGRGGGGGGLTVQGLPLLKPPYSTISAINLDRGEIVWQVPHGDTPDAIRNNPALKGLNIPKTGQSGYNVGTLVTKSLVIAGDGQVTTTPDHPRGAMLRAYDKATGKEVGAVWMPAPQSGSPMTYLLKGRQYIVVAVSGGPYSGEYIAFALPPEEMGK